VSSPPGQSSHPAARDHVLNGCTERTGLIRVYRFTIQMLRVVEFHSSLASSSSQRPNSRSSGSVAVVGAPPRAVSETQGCPGYVRRTTPLGWCYWGCSDVSRAAWGMTATGQGACWRTAWLTEPRSMPVKPPRPRAPTTTRRASDDWRSSSSAG